MLKSHSGDEDTPDQDHNELFYRHLTENLATVLIVPNTVKDAIDTFEAIELPSHAPMLRVQINKAHEEDFHCLPLTESYRKVKTKTSEMTLSQELQWYPSYDK